MEGIRIKINSRDYYELFRFLMEQYGMLQGNIVYVKNIAEWSKEHGIPETDRERPLKLISEEDGCKMLIREEMPDNVIKERINAMRIRSQIQNIALDRADMLDSVYKKLAYLFLSEYATSLADIDDDLSADNWVFDEMEKLGYFKA